MIHIKIIFLFIFILFTACSDDVENQNELESLLKSKDPKVLLSNAKEKQRIGAYEDAVQIFRINRDGFLESINRLIFLVCLKIDQPHLVVCGYQLRVNFNGDI